ncbi:unnamed protein product [Calypogeia fissa]
MENAAPLSTDFDKILPSLCEPEECRRVANFMNANSKLGRHFRVVVRYMPQDEGKEMAFVWYLEGIKAEMALDWILKLGLMELVPLSYNLHGFCSLPLPLLLTPL